MIKGAIFDFDGTLVDSMFIWDTFGEDYLRTLGKEPKENLTETLADICKAVPIPVNAIGGLNKNNIDVLAGIPIAGICVVSAIMKAESPKTATIELKARAKELGII